MIFIETKKITGIESNLISIAHSKNYSVIGICLFDKYCWTNVFGFEILK